MKSVIILCAILSSTMALDLPQKFLRRLETTGGHSDGQGGEFLALEQIVDRGLLRLKACDADLATTAAVEEALEEVLLISDDAGVADLVSESTDLVALAATVELPDLRIMDLGLLRALAQFQLRTIDFAGIIEAIQTGIDSIVATLEEIVALLNDLIVALIEFVNIVTSIIEAITALVSLIQTAIGVLTTIINEAVTIAGDIVGLIGQLISDVVTLIQSIIDSILSIGATVFRGSRYTKTVECRYKSAFAALPPILSTYAAIVAEESP